MRIMSVVSLAVLAALAPVQTVSAADAPQTPPSAVPSPDGAEVLRMAAQAHGGDDWANARSLVLAGHTVFYAPDRPMPSGTADDYRMWRVFDPGRTSAHEAEGKVRIIAKSKGKVLFEVGFDGTTTWTEKGVIPPAEAAAFWASNFGFGIIRHAGKPGFKAVRVPDSVVDGHKVWLVRLTDPQGAETLFGVDQQSHAIRYMGFATPRGWHERHYDDFETLKSPRWLQARHVTLTYNGVKQNEVFWTSTQVNVAVDPSLFTPPAR